MHHKARYRDSLDSPNTHAVDAGRAGHGPDGIASPIPRRDRRQKVEMEVFPFVDPYTVLSVMQLQVDLLTDYSTFRFVEAHSRTAENQVAGGP